MVTNVWDNFGGGGFGGGAGAGDNGGGGSGGGGSSGWAYTPPPPPPTIPSLPTDSVIKKIATAVSSKSDSMFNYANQPSVNKERGVIIVEKNGAIYYKNEVEGDENSCKINYQLDPGERLLGDLHVHQSGDTVPKHRPCFSANDLNEMRYHLQYQFTSFIECGNVRYALVIEDVSKALSFFSSNRPRALISDLTDLFESDPNLYNNGQKVTETILKSYLSPASSTGIGLYISDNANKLTFSSIN